MQLRDDKLREYRVENEVVNTFRLVFIAEPDMKNFRGNVEHKGAIVYTYELGWTA